VYVYIVGSTVNIIDSIRFKVFGTVVRRCVCKYVQYRCLAFVLSEANEIFENLYPTGMLVRRATANYPPSTLYSKYFSTSK
jgi:hypothetical protein